MFSHCLWEKKHFIFSKKYPLTPNSCDLDNLRTFVAKFCCENLRSFTADFVILKSRIRRLYSFLDVSFPNISIRDNQGLKKMRLVSLSNGRRVNVALVWISMLHSSNMDRVRKTRGEGDDLERSNCRWVGEQLTILTILASSFNNTVTFVKNNGQSLGQYSSVLPTVWFLHLSGQWISQIYFSKIWLRISDENYIRLFCWI